MGRKKQSRPNRSRGIIGDIDASDNTIEGVTVDNNGCSEPIHENDGERNVDSGKSIFVACDQSDWDVDGHLDIAEVVLKDVVLANGFSYGKLSEDCCRESRHYLRFQMYEVEEHSCRLGHWPVVSADKIFLEYVARVAHCSVSENGMSPDVILSANFDGPDEGVSGLVHLVSQKLLTLRPVLDDRVLESGPSFRVRVEILKSAFDACGSLLENTRQPWKTSMVNVMAWLRPEVATQEVRYGISEFGTFDKHPKPMVSPVSRKHARFDAAGFYESLRRSKEEPMLEDKLPELLLQLRPYQRRAAYWMVQREKATLKAPVERTPNQFISPFCVPMDFLDRHSRMFYNPFSGSVSLQPESTSYVSGGILADEMGLGKTVELLACIFAHRKPSSEDGVLTDDGTRGAGSCSSSMKRLKRERVECICGAVTESLKYKGLWVQCDMCDAWQHADCVGYSPRVRSSGPRGASNRKGNKNVRTIKRWSMPKREGPTSISLTDGDYLCSSCSELLQGTDPTTTSGATLIVCPAPILTQWHAEIIRHTRPGSVKTCIYEGAKNFSSSNTSAVVLNQLIHADIVLTTYDVLKEDLSHDSDRHDGDRRCMRFQKRYPVLPTLLTRIFWWRICLDEAQMVESNTAAATEMALRLRTQHRWCITGTPVQRRLDDLYGLLRFLGASPFDVHRWWVAIIRDPYERSDVGAMDFTHKLFKKIMWRSSKMHVSDELQLPPQEEHVAWLTFSPIEAHFYQRQHESCAKFAHEIIGSIRDDINKRNILAGLDASHFPFLAHCEAAKLLPSLLKLRQACCHPQVGSSGLRSLQQSPMTMEEILDVLVGKAKTEGEEALRRLVVALNGLAGIAVIEQDLSRAVSLYKEALALAEENSDDFRLDPLLNLHIHHNLAELLPIILENSQQCPIMGGQFSQNPTIMNTESCECSELDEPLAKRQRISKDSDSDLNFDDGHMEQCEKLAKSASHLSTVSVNVKEDKGMKIDVWSQVPSRYFSIGSLRKACENIKQKYLSVFSSKLSFAQHEFKNSYTQVCEAFTKCKGQHETWWLDALDLIEQDKESSNELIRRVDEAVTGSVNNFKSKIATRFRSISGLKYLIQTGLDSLETSRQVLVERLLKIDQTMEKPRDQDIELVRYCPNCQANADGPLCIHCELDELFQVYEARLFRLKSGDSGGMVTSAEEAVGMQKKKSALNRFFGALSHSNKISIASGVDNEKSRRQRDVTANIVVSRSPSELEVTLGVIKSYSRALLGRQAMSSATKQLLLFEAMRKEYAQARCLSIAQAQILRAHDEIKMATSRLRLRETENDASTIDALCSEELIVASVDFSNEKFLSLSSLSRIKGQLRYLKGLVKQKTEISHSNVLSMPQDTSKSHASQFHKRVEDPGKGDDEPCPICHEKLSDQKMVFQCGHITCCKCFVVMMEQLPIHGGKSQEKWVACPTCRQCTNLENIAYIDDKQNRVFDCGMPTNFQGPHVSEISVHVKGSYGTKIEAITRRILYIKSTDPEAKVLVFSSWNDVLDVLEHALEVNDITYIRMKGGRKSNAAIMQFKGQQCGAGGKGMTQERQHEERSIQVLLLLIQHGANGLNILEAQHVVLIEPLLNPAAEAQAVNRVHRIGQKKTTFVHRFIVKDTVEESIYKLNRSRATNLTISGNTKNQDQLALSLKDVESLFSLMMSSGPPENDDEKMGSLRHLPPSVAAGLAAERRLQDHSI